MSKIKNEKMHCLPLMFTKTIFTKTILTSLVFLIVKRPLFSKNYNHISCKLKPLNQLKEF